MESSAVYCVNKNQLIMKKLAALFPLVFAFVLLSAQPIRTGRDLNSNSPQLKSTSDISDFTVVDSDGVEWNLYTLLNGGTTVILDLFQST
jgi:cytochrome oxidase Cu insertion factor (SCO1/SenC/PrrC family)